MFKCLEGREGIKRQGPPLLLAVLLVSAITVPALAYPEMAAGGPAQQAPASEPDPQALIEEARRQFDFMRHVDLEQIRLAAVQHNGRFKTFDTLSREIVQHITQLGSFDRDLPGFSKPVKQEPVFVYLDMIFNPDRYHEIPVIGIKKKPLREQLAQAGAASADNRTLERLRKKGLVSIRFLMLPAVQAELQALSRDVIRSARDVDSIVDAAGLTDPRALRQIMRAIPPPGSTSDHDQWYGVESLAARAPRDAAHAGLAAQTVPGMDAGTHAALSGDWQAAAQAWRAGDAAAASAALNKLATGLAAVNPVVYPVHSKLSLEHWYYKHNKMTWVWWFYMLAVVFLLMGIVYRWRRAMLFGIGAFGLAFILHTIASGIRWYLAGRIPNTNMFEAVTAAAWFGVAIAMFYELGPVLRPRKLAWWLAWVSVIGGSVVFVLSLAIMRIPYNEWQQWGPVPTASLIIASIGCMGLIAMTTSGWFLPRGLTLLGAAVAGMVAMMCGNFMTVSLNSNISNVMPVLNDLWLYIHVNVIIASYALIGMAAVTAAMYIVGRLLTRPTQGLWMALLIPTVVIPLPALLPTITVSMVMAAWSPFLVVLGMFAVAWTVRLVWRRAADQAYAAWEGAPLMGAGMVGAGAGALPPDAASGAFAASDGGRGGRNEREGLARVLDGSTMLMLQLSFITLWSGIIMGAIWADHSWGRPWGWDPKEVFALNTWIIFLILVHVRLKVRDKQLWTAVLAIFGCSVMLFNWIVVNFFITGLHSYA